MKKSSIRQRIFEIIEKSDGKNKPSLIYDLFMIFCIGISLFPLAMKNAPSAWITVEWVTTVIFVVDYVLRLWTADLKLSKGKWSFVLYPFSFMALIDLLSILPTFFLLSDTLRLLKTFRLLRALRCFKLFKGFRYSKNIEIIASVFRRQKRSLLTVCVLAVGYIFLSALIVFNVEPDTFPTFFDAVYWATVSLTTVGYGDIYTVSFVGRAITMISAILGVAIVALPAGIITAGYMNEIQKEDGDREDHDL
jgi:voltage-gated potassium channel